MARKPKQAIVVEVPERAESDAVSDAEEKQASADEAQVSADLPTRADVQIFRLDPRSQKMSFLDRLQTPEVTTEQLRDNYGGGKYELVFRRPVDGRVKVTQRRTVNIDPKIPALAPPSVRFDLEASGAVRPVNGQSQPMDVISAGILQLFESQRASQTMQMQLFERALQPKEAIPWDKIIGAATTLVPLFTHRDQKDPMQTAREIAALAVENRAPMSSVRDTLGAVKEILEIRDLVPGSEPDEPMMWLAKNLGPPVLEMLAAGRAQQQRALPTATPGVAPTPTPPPPPPRPAVAPPDTTPVWRLAMQRELPALLSAAAKDKDPELFGAFLAENLPEQFRGDVKRVCASPTFVEETLAAFPEMQHYPEWFRDGLSAFRDHVLGTDEVDEEPLPEGEAPG